MPRKKLHARLVVNGEVQKGRHKRGAHVARTRQARIAHNVIGWQLARENGVV